MFSIDTYIKRRQELKKLVGKGVIILFGNNDSPANYPANAYAPMRQDSSFLYYFGQHRDGLVGVIDIDNDEEIIFGNDIDVEDIVWMGFTPSVADLAAEVGVKKTAPMKELATYIHHLSPNSKDPCEVTGGSLPYQRAGDLRHTGTILAGRHADTGESGRGHLHGTCTKLFDSQCGQSETDSQPSSETTQHRGWTDHEMGRHRRKCTRI
jgi:hypothetical protein